MIIQNAIMIIEDWPEVSFLVSSHVHDFRTHTFRNGTSVSVDGGQDYIRRCHPPNFAGYGTKYMEYNLDDTEPFYVIKSKLLWGTRGKDGRQPLKWVRLIDCDADHLYKILTTQPLNTVYKEVINTILFDDRKYLPPARFVNIPYIHKAVRPVWANHKTVCGYPPSKFSTILTRTRWTNVTCPLCLKKRKHNDF